MGVKPLSRLWITVSAVYFGDNPFASATLILKLISPAFNYPDRLLLKAVESAFDSPAGRGKRD